MWGEGRVWGLGYYEGDYLSKPLKIQCPLCDVGNICQHLAGQNCGFRPSEVGTMYVYIYIYISDGLQLG